MWLFGKPVDKLRAAGCRVNTYQTIKWYSLARLNNRTHRELFVIDGTTAFIGGAGVADWWAHEHKGRPHWRDTMVRVDGPAVSSIQGVFAENWLECCGEILTGDAYFRRSTSRATARRSSSRVRRRIARPRCAWCFKA